MLVSIEKTVVEGAGAAGLAAMLAQPERFRGRKIGPSCAAAISTRTCSPMCWCANWSAAAASPASGSRRRTGPARSRRSPPSSTNAGSTSSRSTTTASSPRLPAKDTVIEVECEARDSASAIEKLVDAACVERPSSSQRASLDLTLFRPAAAQSRSVNPLSMSPNSFLPRSPARIKSFVTICGEGRRGERTISLSQVLCHQPSPCPYLPGKTERKVFTELNGRMPASSTKRSAGSASAAANRSPTARAASTARPASRSGSSPTSSRPTRTQRKLLRRHADLEVTACRPWTTEEQYAAAPPLSRAAPPRRRHGRDGRDRLTPTWSSRRRSAPMSSNIASPRSTAGPASWSAPA